MRTDRAERIRNPPPEIKQKLGALRQCRELIKDLNSRLRTAQNDLNRLETELASYHASIAPIQDCPLEVLEMIFELYLGSKPRRIRSLMLVCREWHAVITSNSRIWTDIPISFEGESSIHQLVRSSNRYLNACFQNSRGSLLNLTMDFGELLFNFKHGVFTNASKRTSRTQQPLDSMHLIPSIIEGCENLFARCRTLTLTFPDSEMLSLEIWRSLSLDAPNVVQLSIYSVGDAYNINGQAFVGGFRSMSSIRSFTLDEVPDLNFVNLDWACVEDLEVRTDLGCSGTLQLERFSGLLSLTILYTSQRWRSEAAMPSDALSLPALKELSLIGNFSSISKVIFSLPAIEHLYIQHAPGEIGVPLDLPNINVPTVAWSNLNCQTGVWAHGSRVQLSRIMVHFPKSEILVIPARSKKVITSIIEKFRKAGSIPGLWKAIVLEDESGEVETMKLEDT